MSTTETPVLIVGAGPAGLVLALSLVQSGVPVRIVEKAGGLAKGQRGAGIMPRSMELFRALGVLPDILKYSTPVPRIMACEPGTGVDKVISVSEMSPYIVPTPDCPYLTPISLGSERVLRILSDHLKQYGCEIQFNTELKTFKQRDDHVVAHLLNTESGAGVMADVTVGYLVGADGTRGAVRKMLGLSFFGETRDEEQWVVADVRLKGIDKEFWHMWGDFQGGLLMIRPTERCANDEYWVGIGGRNIDYATLSTKPEEFAKFARDRSGLQSLEFLEFVTLNHFRINVRMVDKFGQGRVFVAGDAAHAHSFTGALGMNSSIQDAFNLAWKLALVTKSLASSEILDSYTSERLPVIADVLGKTTEILKTTIRKSAEREYETSWRRDRKWFQLDITYRGSFIVFDELDSSSPRRISAGDRAPNAPGNIPLTPGFKPGSSELFDVFNATRHTALIFSQNKEEVAKYISALQQYPPGAIYPVVILPKGSHPADEPTSVSECGADVMLDNYEHCWSTYPTLEGAKVVIVRPDGYVGAIARSLTGIGQYKTIVFG